MFRDARDTHLQMTAPNNKLKMFIKYLLPLEFSYVQISLTITEIINNISYGWMKLKSGDKRYPSSSWKIRLRLKHLLVIFKNPFISEWMQWALNVTVYIACMVMIALLMNGTEDW